MAYVVLSVLPLWEEWLLWFSCSCSKNPGGQIEEMATTLRVAWAIGRQCLQ